MLQVVQSYVPHTGHGAVCHCYLQSRLQTKELQNAVFAHSCEINYKVTQSKVSQRVAAGFQLCMEAR